MDDCLVVAKEAHFQGGPVVAPDNGRGNDGVEFLELDAVGGLVWSPSAIEPFPV